ncbi:Uncharacterised protein [Mycobacteroides abscessus subsp. abscessus]|nr:Uncharacterised protein [Mycobacteroides abscessus]SHW13052.1 Uncharacterised protein [Mycobacteroides abscessus subsp. abscessus]
MGKVCRIQCARPEGNDRRIVRVTRGNHQTASIGDTGHKQSRQKIVSQMIHRKGCLETVDGAMVGVPELDPCIQYQHINRCLAKFVLNLVDELCDAVERG